MSILTPRVWEKDPEEDIDRGQGATHVVEGNSKE